MDDISIVIHQFQDALKGAIDAEVRRQISQMIGNKKVELPVVVESIKGKRGPKTGSTAAGKPCPVCGLVNKGRRFRFYCADHRDQIPAKAA